MIQDSFIIQKIKEYNLNTSGTSSDEWLNQYAEGNPLWVVRLSNNLIIYQNDGQYGPQHKSWQALRSFCYDTDLKIVDMSFGFRSNRFSLPERADGYFFSRAIRANFGGSDSSQLWFLGTIQHDCLVVQKWKVPEMILDEVEIRESNQDSNRENLCLITNYLDERSKPNSISQSMEQKVS